jgi:hypothetical protein
VQATRASLTPRTCRAFQPGEIDFATTTGFEATHEWHPALPDLGRGQPAPAVARDESCTLEVEQDATQVEHEYDRGRGRTAAEVFWLVVGIVLRSRPHWFHLL